MHACMHAWTTARKCMHSQTSAQQVCSPAHTPTPKIPVDVAGERTGGKGPHSCAFLAQCDTHSLQRLRAHSSRQYYAYVYACMDTCVCICAHLHTHTHKTHTNIFTYLDTHTDSINTWISRLPHRFLTNLTLMGLL
jgi:hypothetical protein